MPNGDLEYAWEERGRPAPRSLKLSFVKIHSSNLARLKQRFSAGSDGHYASTVTDEIINLGDVASSLCVEPDKLHLPGTFRIKDNRIIKYEF